MSSIHETTYFETEEDQILEEEANETYSDKDCILFAIDCRVSMVTPDSEGNVPLFNIFTSLKSTILSKIFTRPLDQVGVVLYNTAKTNNPNKHEHIYVLDELDVPDAPRIKSIENFIRDQDKFQDKFGSIDKEVPMSEVFWTCSTIFSENAPKISDRRIFLITDQDNPNSDNPQYRATAITKAKDTLNLHIGIELFGLDTADHKFDVSLFYNDILEVENIEKNRSSICNTENLANLIAIRQSKKRSDFSIPFKIAENFVIGVKGYSLVLEQKIKPGTYLATSGQQVAQAKIISRIKCVDTQEYLTLADLKYAYDYGGEKVVFTEKEMKELHRLKDPGLNIVGFKNKSSILSYYQIAHPYFIYPDEGQYEGSSKVFFQLLDSMDKKGKSAICSMVRRANTDVRMVALLPQKEVTNEQGFQLKPPGFHVIVLPWAEEIRPIPVESTPTPERAEIETMVEMIERATLLEYDPSAHPNPNIEKHNNMIKAIALEQNIEEPIDTLIPNPQFLQLTEKINEFKTLIHLQNLTIEAVQLADTTKRKATEAGNDVKRLKQANLSIEELWQLQKLESVTNANLKQWLLDHGMAPKNRKADLIQQITDILSSRAT